MASNWKAKKVKPLNLSLNLPQGLKSSALKVCCSFMEKVLWVQRVSATGCHPTLLCSHRVHFPSKNREGQGWKEETKVGSSKTALERLSKKPGNLLAWG